VYVAWHFQTKSFTERYVQGELIRVRVVKRCVLSLPAYLYVIYCQRVKGSWMIGRFKIETCMNFGVYLFG
jgi:hypothetical protein